MSEEQYSLIVAFPDDSPSFVHGVEAGQVWRDLENGRDTPPGCIVMTATVHTENREVIQRMAEATGNTVRFDPTEVDGWDLATFVRKPRRPLRLIEGGLGE